MKVSPLSPREIAKEIISVQPISGDFFKKLLELSKDEKQLRLEGYEPVSNLKLMWIK